MYVIRPCFLGLTWVCLGAQVLAGNVTLYSGPACTGEEQTVTAANREPLCTSCFDLCRKVFEGTRSPMHDEVSPPHSKVTSLRVNVPAGSGNQLTVHTYANCHGTWNYGQKNHDRRATYDEQSGCVSFPPTDEARPVHFELRVLPVVKNFVKVPQTPAADVDAGGSVDPRADPVRQALGE